MSTQRASSFLTALATLLMVLLGTVQAFAVSGRFIDDNDMVTLKGNTHPLALNATAKGAADTNLPMERMVMALKVPAGKRTALETFLKQQQDPASPNYRKWLTPEQFAAQFGPSEADVVDVTSWLTSHGFNIDEVAKSRMWINFSGDVGMVEQTFKTRIETVTVDGHTYHANASDPSFPRALTDVVSGIVTLHNIPRRPLHNGATAFASNQAVPNYTSGSDHYLSPGDFATIYNVTPLYNAGIDGKGQSIAIVGRTHPSATNWSTFRSKMGLAKNDPQVIVNGTDPGSVSGDEDTEANLDVEWAGAVAKKATIKFVTSKSTGATDGVDLSAQYIVANNVAPILSVSFGSCESDMGSAENSFYNNLWAQAAAQGQTVLVASGDSGAAGCSAANAPAGTGKAVNGLASTPYNIAVGGTQFDEGSTKYWDSVSSTSMTSALSYIPEVAWNESGLNGGFGLWASGGGASGIYSKPSWQAAKGVPQDGKRDVPDVSLSGAGHDAYLIVTGGSLSTVSGTSAAAPSFAGIMALLVQNSGQRLGNANSGLYRLASQQYRSSGTKMFHDVSSGDNSVPNVTGYRAGVGYDQVTGLGSVDANALITGWGAGSTASKSDFALSAPTSQTVIVGGSGTVKVSTSVSGGFNSAVALSVSGLPSGVTASFSPSSIAAPGSGSSALTLTVASTARAGTSSITITATGGGVTHTASVALTIQSQTLYRSDFTDQWQSGRVSGVAGAWFTAGKGSYPAAAPHTGTSMALFSSYVASSGSQGRLSASEQLAIPSCAKTATLAVWMYHDPNRSGNNDRVQVQISSDGRTWSNVGSAVSRYATTAGWRQVTVDVSSYIGRSVYLGFLGTGAAGYNMYLDDVTVTVK